MPNKRKILSFKDVGYPYKSNVNWPVYGMSIMGWLEYCDGIKQRLIKINKSRELRYIIIESWLMIDDLIRELLMGPFELHNFSDEEFQAKYRLLPQSFDSCLQLLTELHKWQIGLDRTLDDSENIVRLSGHFWINMYMNDRELFDKVRSKLIEWYKIHHPELVKHESDVSGIYPQKRIPFRFSKQWMDTVGSLDEDWLKTARKINKARNIAAHNSKNETIHKALGVNGKNADKLAKDTILKALEKVTGIYTDTTKWIGNEPK